MKTDDVFLKLGNQTIVFTKGRHHDRRQENVFLQFVEFKKMSSWERNISEHDIMQHTQIITEICFFLYHKLGMWNRNKQIDLGQIKVVNNMN